ncbi:MAG TPA: diheme cytochrome c [Burkholderiaceae bacterium]|nr:diheme cytochrome c [Burkholderiaceae bacterium]
MNSPLASLPRPAPHAALLLAAALAVLVAAPLARADHGPLLPRNTPQAYTQECASCHSAYPPALLPAASWQRLMGGLKQHYGSDASLDPATLAQLSQWLQANAGTYKRVSEAPPQDRITRSAWFERKHRRIDATVWALPSVKSAANCAACHSGADQGRYGDDDLRYPAGLSLRQRWMWRD